MATMLFACTLIALLFSSLFQRYVGHTMTDPDLDFYDYFFEAKSILEHPRANIYAGALEGNPVMHSVPSGSPIDRWATDANLNMPNLYIYPPMLADLLIPLSKLPPRTAAVLWRALNLLLVASTCLLLARLLRLRILSSEFAVLLVAAYLFWPVHETISLGQISIALMALWALGIAAYAEDKILLSAAAFALATSLKVTPVLVLPLMLVWRDRRWIGAYLVSLTGFLLLTLTLNGWTNVVQSMKVLRHINSVVPALPNKCVSAVAGWIYYRQAFTYGEAKALIAAAQPPRLLLAASLLSLTLYIGCLGLAWRKGRGPSRHSDAVVLGVMSVVCSLVSPVSWRHGYSASFVLFAILWARNLRSSAPNMLHLVLLALSSFTVGTLLFDLIGRLAFLPSFLQIFFAGLWPILCVFLCLEVLWNKTDVAEAAMLTS